MEGQGGWTVFFGEPSTLTSCSFARTNSIISFECAGQGSIAVYLVQSILTLLRYSFGLKVPPFYKFLFTGVTSQLHSTVLN